MSEVSSGHMVIEKGRIVGGNFVCAPEQLEILNQTIKTFSALVIPSQDYSGEVSLIEFLCVLEQKYEDLSTPLLKEINECFLDIHRNSVTIH